MQLTSSSFTSGAAIPQKHAYYHDNISPELEISGAPLEAKSFALIVFDPDAPNGNFTHWLVWNIPPTTAKFVEGNLPLDVVQGTNDFGQAEWDGPAPPSGTHNYHFVLYALDGTLDLPAGSKRAELDQAVAAHMLEKAELVGTFTADQAPN